jgi:hypothetical protein
MSNDNDNEKCKCRHRLAIHGPQTGLCLMRNCDCHQFERLITISPPTFLWDGCTVKGYEKKYFVLKIPVLNCEFNVYEFVNHYSLRAKKSDTTTFSEFAKCKNWLEVNSAVFNFLKERIKTTAKEIELLEFTGQNYPVFTWKKDAANAALLDMESFGCQFWAFHCTSPSVEIWRTRSDGLRYKVHKCKMPDADEFVFKYVKSLLKQGIQFIKNPHNSSIQTTNA